MEPPRWKNARLRRQRQQADDLERRPWSQRWATRQVCPASSRCQSYKLESLAQRSFGDRRRHSWPAHQILEHSHSAAYQRHQHRKSSMQLSLFEDEWRAGEHAWVQLEPNNSVEVSNDGEDCYFDRTHVSRPISSHEPRWVLYCHGCWWWNFEILEHFPKISKQPWCSMW